jgi:hypothetical protein
LDLKDAQSEANPGQLKEWAGYLEMVAPIITAVVGIIGLVTAAQWLWNASLWASPVTWIVIGIVALIAVIVLIATQTTWFQDIWNAAWGWIKSTAQDFWGWITETLWPGIKKFFVDNWNGIKAVGQAFADAWGWIRRTGESWWGWIKGIPGMLGNAFSSVYNFIVSPFKNAFNAVARAWNNTVGQLHWSVPGWVPGIGGNSFSAPRLPYWHTGGIVSGALGSEVLGVLKAGERVTAGPNSDSGGVVTLNSSGSAMDDFILDSVRRAVGLRGGDPVRVLAGSRG